MINFEAELNQEQLSVVKNGDGPCLVLAGAGSGKTRTIIYRVAYLLEHGVNPENILLVTFTNKAAKGMVDRLKDLTPTHTSPAGRRGGDYQGEEAIKSADFRLPWSGTFHHIGYRILRKYAPLLGYKNNFTVLDSADSLDLLKLCLKQEGIDRKEKRFPSPQVIHSIISYARNSEKIIYDVLDQKHPKWLEIADKISAVAENYQNRKKIANAMDFDDLLVNTYLLLLKYPEVRNKFADQFEYVLVDEYQDTNKIQASIIKQFSFKHRNVLVVGDDAQSIYSFRAADIQNILSFNNDYPEAKIFRLETNYRSTPNILSVANCVIAQNKKQYPKELKSVMEKFLDPEIHSFADQTEEAKFIAENILSLREEGVPLNQIAVLFRAAYHSQALEMELNKNSLSYDYRGGIRFFERAHIKDVLAYLRIYANKNDEIAWSRVLNMQVGIGPSGAEKIYIQITNGTNLRITNDNQQEKENKQLSIEELESLGSVLSARGQIGWRDFLSIWQKIMRSDGSPEGLISAVLDSKYIDYLELEYPDYRERMQDIEQLALFAKREGDLSQFLAEATMQESYNSNRNRDTELDNQEKIVLSTIHQAKGLEWQVVFILNVSAGQFPNERAVFEDNGLEEERRLLYVAITRAKKYLYFTYPLMSSINSYLQGPSRFLDEIDRDLVKYENGGESGSSVFDDLDDAESDIKYISEDLPFGNKPFKKGFLKDVDEL